MNSNLIGIIVTVLVIILIAGFSLMKLKESSKWPSIKGEILISKMDSIRNADSSDYLLTIQYRYQVEGKEYIGDTITAGFPNIVDRLSTAENLLKEYPVGKEVSVYYNPKSPSDSSLQTGKVIPIAGYFLIGFIVFLAGGIIIGGQYLLNKN